MCDYIQGNQQADRHTPPPTLRAAIRIPYTALGKIDRMLITVDRSDRCVADLEVEVNALVPMIADRKGSRGARTLFDRVTVRGVAYWSI